MSEMRVAPEASPGGEASAPDAKPATPAQVRELILELLDETGYRESFLRALRDERVLELDTALAIADRRLNMSAVAGMAGGPFGAAAALVPTPLLLADAKLLVDHNVALVKAVQKSPDWQAFRLNAPPAPFPPGPPGGPTNHALARLLLPAMDRAVGTHFRVLARRRMAAAALAVKWYQADHGKPPRTLEELVPKYLPAVPADPFAAASPPLRYVSDEARLVIYSVSENGADENGSEVPLNRRKQTDNRWEHQDAVLSLKPKVDGAAEEKGVGEKDE